MNEDLKQRIEELAKDEEYMKYLLSLDSAEKMSEELGKKDIELSPEEIRQIGTLLRKKQTGELTDEDLEEVAGGSAGVGIAFGITVSLIIIFAAYSALKNSC